MQIKHWSYIVRDNSLGVGMDYLCTVSMSFKKIHIPINATISSSKQNYYWYSISG